MSSCDTCDCADKTNCPKKGNSYGLDLIETEKSYIETVVVEAPAAAEHGGNSCKCGPSCACVDCKCGQ